METVVDTLDPVRSTVTTKRALLVASHAIERAFDGLSGPATVGASDVTSSDEGDDRGLVIGYFQRREYFDVEADRYAALAAAGHVVVAAFTGSVDRVPHGITVVQLDDDDPQAGDWVVAMVRGGFGATLSARDLHQLSVSEATLEASRLFRSWTSLRRHRTVMSTRRYLDHLATRLPSDVVVEARARLDASAALPATLAEDRLAAAADHLIRSIDAGYRRANALRVELQSTTERAERDHLTGLHNRHYLERYLGGGDRPADLLALLVDVDGLKQVNDTHGHEAGDALLRCVAATLQEQTRAGDVVVRWGGDEFLLLVPAMRPEAGLAYGERLARAIRVGVVDPPWGHLVPSASIGVSPTRHTPLPMSQLDTALYQVKRDGKGHAALVPPP